MSNPTLALYVIRQVKWQSVVIVVLMLILIYSQVRQVSTSLAWGLVFGTVTSLVANQMNLNRLSIKNQGFFPWSYVILKKSSFGLGVTLLLHLVLVTWVAEEQHQEWKRIFIKALRAIDAEKSGSLRFETKIQDPLIS